jgi:threonylcarbamoyladenosine tRNA methylthiotransferase MtaB
MGRRYTSAEFSAQVEYAARRVPDIMIGTDVIVGFPGETDKDFETCRELLERLPIHYFHVFRYSHRERARSRGFKGEVRADVAVKRADILRRLSEKKKAAFLKTLLGTEQSVLFEQRKGDYWIGHTDNYVTIRAHATENLGNAFRRVTVTEVQGQAVLAVLSDRRSPHGPETQDRSVGSCA